MLTLASQEVQLPAFATLERWIELSGVSRSTTYELLGSGDLIARKLGKRVLIDVQHGLKFLNSLPKAEIRTPKSA